VCVCRQHIPDDCGAQTLGYEPMAPMFWKVTVPP